MPNGNSEAVLGVHIHLGHWLWILVGSAEPAGISARPWQNVLSSNLTVARLGFGICGVSGIT